MLVMPYFWIQYFWYFALYDLNATTVFVCICVHGPPPLEQHQTEWLGALELIQLLQVLHHRGLPDVWRSVTPPIQAAHVPPRRFLGDSLAWALALPLGCALGPLEPLAASGAPGAKEKQHR